MERAVCRQHASLPQTLLTHFSTAGIVQVIATLPRLVGGADSAAVHASACQWHALRNYMSKHTPGSTQHPGWPTNEPHGVGCTQPLAWRQVATMGPSWRAPRWGSSCGTQLHRPGNGVLSLKEDCPATQVKVHESVLAGSDYNHHDLSVAQLNFNLAEPRHPPTHKKDEQMKGASPPAFLVLLNLTMA